MLNSLVAFLNRISTDEMLLDHKKTNVKDIIYRDELSKEKNNLNKFLSSEPFIKMDLGEKICTTCTTATNGKRTSMDSSEEEK
ncbi:LOW QUALITY PROTEIN: hypothetical protein PanWU01x14_260460 [Parasponia andersonii]|uniref:Uncharacterized protein n=1 Tax=Parasponia andersonii TaxID=3476 RepID=A0A2P5B8X7_PARAD|nr:LOW QUALITY PROTEIN: hypothetical protein PanWU01x14_260460 [Parasponia andersonii]